MSRQAAEVGPPESGAGPTDDLSAEEMSSLESAAAPVASNHAHPMPTRPETGIEAGS